MNKHFTYRCKHRRACGVVIKIEKEELKKSRENKDIQIQYTITSSIKQHVCLKENKEKANIENSKNELKERKIKNKELIRSLILSNIDKPKSFHKTNLFNNNILLSNNQIKWLLQKIC